MRLRSYATVLACALCLCSLGCRVTPAGRIETSIILWTKHHLTVRGSKNINPVRSSVETIEAGKQTFGFYCVVCHGRDGQNTGVPFANNMKPAIPSLASHDVQRYSDGQLKWIIENGIAPSGMPAARGILSDEDMWTIVVYLRNLPAAGSLGEPRAYSGDEYVR